MLGAYWCQPHQLTICACFGYDAFAVNNGMSFYCNHFQCLCDEGGDVGADVLWEKRGPITRLVDASRLALVGGFAVWKLTTFDDSRPGRTWCRRLSKGDFVVSTRRGTAQACFRTSELCDIQAIGDGSHAAPLNTE
ncbi:uncharacterized protein ARMOST_18200 [Armillaria ostoyae]|uniref:Uncharacterized protein n=1 Tax=Armillaria ostoyae TaxID=47428 RepID=A0A284S150_ARMOS|nr:uncharacterized protein ARMOST_18200 [Armillaria ostoyae]